MTCCGQPMQYDPSTGQWYCPQCGLGSSSSSSGCPTATVGQPDPHAVMFVVIRRARAAHTWAARAVRLCGLSHPIARAWLAAAARAAAAAYAAGYVVRDVHPGRDRGDEEHPMIMNRLLTLVPSEVAEPSAAELDLIEAEMPVIEAEVALLDLEISLLDRVPSELDVRRLERARRRVETARAAVAAHRGVA